MRVIELQKSFFIRNQTVDEWAYFLDELGLTVDPDSVDSIEIDANVLSLDGKPCSA